MHKSLVMHLVGLLLFAVPSLAALPPDANAFEVSGEVTAIIIDVTRVGFVVSAHGTNDILIPCLALAPTAGCEQVVVGDYVQVKGYFTDYQTAGDGTRYDYLILSEIWRCIDNLAITVCVEQTALTCVKLPVDLD